MNILVTDIQRFCMHDGPGIRTTVFLCGCLLRCAWCHNPETQPAQPVLLYTAARCIGCGACAGACPHGVHTSAPHTLDRARCTICGRCAAACPTGALRLSARAMSVEEIVRIALRDAPFYGASGGVTLSGGEPLLHTAQALTLLRACKEAGLHTAVETSGFFDSSALAALTPYIDLVLWDVKDTDSARHRQHTGHFAEPGIENLRRADAYGVKTRLRCIVVAGVNAVPAHAAAVAGLFRTLRHCTGVDFLPCHMMSGGKYAALGRTCPLGPEAACPPALLAHMQAAFARQLNGAHQT